MTRTAAQKAADEQLAEAVRACMRADGVNDAGLIVEFMTIVATTTFDGEESLSGLSFHTPGDIPHYRMLGMLDVIASGLRAQITGTVYRPDLS